jgi:hypothetical protein
MTQADCQRMRSWGVLSIAEVRAMEDLGPVESRLVTALPWIGLSAAIVGLVFALALPGPRPMYASFGPDDLKSWATAIPVVVSSLCAAAHTAVIFIRWLKGRPKQRSKPRAKKKHEAPGEQAH